MEEAHGGWRLTFTDLEFATDVRVRLGDGDFEAVHAPSLENPAIDVPRQTPRSPIELRYRAGGAVRDPRHYTFDPYVAALPSTKWELELPTMRDKWVGWSHLGDTVQVSFGLLLIHTCMLEAVEYGWDAEEPERRLSLPTCQGFQHAHGMDGPEAYVDAPPQVKSVSVRVTYVDGTQSEVLRFPNPGPRE